MCWRQLFTHEVLFQQAFCNLFLTALLCSIATVQPIKYAVNLSLYFPTGQVDIVTGPKIFSLLSRYKKQNKHETLMVETLKAAGFC